VTEPDRDIPPRFAVPFTSPPQLSFADAVLATFVACIRIFVGSLLFAVWGSSSLLAWTVMDRAIWRVAVTALLFLLLVLAMTLLIRVTSALAGKLSTRHP
jgi:hypothetical protein